MSSAVSAVFTFNASLSELAPSSLISLSAFSFSVMVKLSCLVLLCCCKHPISNIFSVLLTFNASLSVLAPRALISLSALLQCWKSLAFLVLFCFCFHPMSKVASVVLTFNASLSARTPSALILLAVSFILYWCCFEDWRFFL